MSNFAMLSILPFLGILFIIWRILRVAKSTSNRFNWSQRLNKWVLYIYVGILLLAAFVYELISANGDEIVAPKEYTMLKTENKVFQQAFENNEESKFDPNFLVEEWTQELEGDTLEIISIGSNFPTERLNIEWTDSKEQLVEVKMYKTHSYMDGINLGEEIPLSKIEIKDKQIILKAPPHKELTYYRFSNELAALSIVDSLDVREQRRVLGYTYIYLKVPKHINVIDKDGLQFY
ncbi:hypothetical protein [Psychrobacillus sp. OK032]|uniref:hypothetical protein n=1 Tax=Psychrobacillus sp. OK032 TaxID=1884358 RepID=UPI0008C4E788|nr:hypothetical protein [Psychrobacillus sp. OK032]SES36821.1 hypothetical protein SAMN05518872_1097 [Psychrobacillus sp. OK032]